MYYCEYKTPDGLSDMVMSSDGEYLTGLWFKDSKDCSKHKCNLLKKLPIFDETIKWLYVYFSGCNPDFIPKYRIEELTEFRKLVINFMNDIPYGEVVTYNDIAHDIEKIKGIKKMSAQAVGGAVGWNPICIIIPCHRVVGTNDKITGYGGGIKNKIKLLELEGIDVSKYE